jgi:O-antigen ligase
MVNRVALTIVFLLSFWAYLAPELTLSRRFAPLILFAVLVFFKVFCSKSALAAMGSLLDTDALLFVFFLSLLTLGPSMASNFDKSMQYWLLISVTLILARLYMAVVPVTEVLEAFFWSGVLCVGTFAALVFSDFVFSVINITRFSAFAFEPNVLAFVLTGYSCVMAWKFIRGGWRMRILTGVVGTISLVIILFASSRGSIVAILSGCATVAGVTIFRAKKEQRRRVLFLGLATSASLLALLLFAEYRGWTADAFDYADQILSLTSADRGIDSGLTGRVDKWNEILHQMSSGNWLLGQGLRSSDSMSPPIDNSYLVILYELGLFPFALIIFRFFTILSRFIRGYLHSMGPRQRGLYLTCTLLMAVFLVNDIVGRFMFALANPYSLFAFLLFAAPNSAIALNATRSKSKAPRTGYEWPRRHSHA